jgi:glycine cleavage system H protein
MGELNYQRCRFSTALPEELRYTPSHYWLREQSPGIWQVGLTPWAIRLLGDFVECQFDAAPGAQVKLGQSLGWLEGFKALTDIDSVGDGVFQGANPILVTNLDVIAQDAYGNGWLYVLRGTVDSGLLEARRYAVLLDQTIDELRARLP